MAIYEFANCPCGYPIKQFHRKGPGLGAPWIECPRCRRRFDEPDSNEWDAMTLFERWGIWPAFLGAWVYFSMAGLVVVAIGLTAFDWFVALPDTAWTVGIYVAVAWAILACGVSAWLLRANISESQERMKDPEYRTAVESWVQRRRDIEDGR